MVSIISIFSSLIISFSGLFFPLGAIFHFEGQTPNNLGVVNSQLASCPPSPNCVVSQDADSSHYIKPLTYQLDRTQAYDSFLKILSVVPDTKIVEQKDNYIRTESRSKIMGFVDDAEFYFPEGEKVIQWRSASRLGESDLGVNRRRLEQIRLAFDDLVN
ncbi:DUF1499 domain-containing protein [Geminocystis herdmanii]|uniref:DUF1499 domain-containing protein n=1 Tax=Geminocystis herdmanii TaxID=669359 RepID=UPI00034B0A44|nr:DUF1499 domain-containing protein [Geminocystis herdmanii]